MKGARRNGRFPRSDQDEETESVLFFFPALPIEYETLSVNNWKFERMKRELDAEFSLEKHSNQNHKQTQKTPKQHTSKQTKQKATSNELSQNHVKQSETPRAPFQPLNASLPPSSSPPSHPCKVQMSLHVKYLRYLAQAGLSHQARVDNA